MVSELLALINSMTDLSDSWSARGAVEVQKGGEAVVAFVKHGRGIVIMNIGGLLKSVVNPANLAMAMMGPGGWAMMAAKTIGAAIGQQVIQQLGQKLGLPPAMIAAAQTAFSAATGTGSLPTTARGAANLLGSQMNLSPTQQGNLERSTNDAIQQLVSQGFKDQLGFKDENGKPITGVAKKGDFFMRMASLMGQKLNDGFDSLEKKANATDWKNTKDVTEFQAEQQKFSMFANAVTAAVKTIGEALGSMARKG